jgi:hypothetical protein
MANTDSKDAKQTAAAEPVDYVRKIGANFNLHNATAIFGKDKALPALQAYAQHGGHGVITEGEYTDQLFGGLGAPSDTDAARQTAINNALNKLAQAQE